MTEASAQDLQIVQAFSSAEVPERIIRESNIKELIQGMTAEQEAVQTDARRLERLRGEKKDGNFIGNWWHDRDDKVQDAQIDLNQSIGRLTRKSSQLLIVNTAISKVLSDQQRMLLRQQELLKQQADDLAEQNHKIFEQQQLLERQQQAINAANQGLMEAKGITQEHAQQLVGCVVRVTEAEQKIDAANQELRAVVAQQLHDATAQCFERLDAGFAEFERRQLGFEQRIAETLAAQTQRLQGEWERRDAEDAMFRDDIEGRLKTARQEADAATDHKLLTLRGAVEPTLRELQTELGAKGASLRAMEAELAALQAQQRETAGRVRLALAVTAGLGLIVLAWEAVGFFMSF